MYVGNFREGNFELIKFILSKYVGYELNVQ